MRLIDADAFERFIQEYCQDSLVDLWCELVKMQPTAYDVDKVVERLEKLSNEVLSNIFAYEEDDHKGIYNDGLSKGYEKSAEIVKSGGIR